MPIRPSASYSMYYSGLPAILNIDLNLMLIISTVTFYFSFISILYKYRNVVYEVTDALQKSFFF
jgi:hypothetical protein